MPYEFKPFNYGNVLRNIEAVKGARIQNQLREMQMGELQNKSQFRNALRGMGRNQREVPEQAFQADPLAALDLENTLSQMDAQSRERAINQGVQTMDYIGRLASSVSDQASYDQAISEAAQTLGPEAVHGAPARFDMGGQQWVNQQMQKALSVKDRLALQTQQGDLSEREKKIQNLIGRGIDPNTANDVVNGIVELTGPDQFGNVYSINKATGDRRTVVSQGQASQQAQAPRQQGGQQPSRLNLERSAEKGTGPIAKVKSGLGAMFGWMMEGEAFPDTEQARQDLRLFNQEAKQALVNNPRFPVAEQKIIQDMLPDPTRMFTDPDTERKKIQRLRNFLESKKDQNIQILEQSRLTEKRRGELVDQNAAIDRVLGIMGSEDSQSTKKKLGEKYGVELE